MHRLLSIQLIVVVLLSSCKKDETAPVILPVACFTSELSVARNQLLNFDASCSSNSLTFRWRFGDGGESTEQRPQHSFSITGSYDVTLIVTNNEHTDSIKKNIIVVPVLTEQACVPTFFLGATPFANGISDSTAISYLAGHKLNDIKWFGGSNTTFYQLRAQFSYAVGVLTDITFYAISTLNPVTEISRGTYQIIYNTNGLPSRINYTQAGDSTAIFNFYYDSRNRMSVRKQRYAHISAKRIIRYEYGADGNIAQVFSGHFDGASANILAREYTAYDSSVPFYSGSKELRIFFEYIQLLDPFINNFKAARIYQTEGGVEFTNYSNLEVTPSIHLNDQGLINEYAGIGAACYSSVYKVGYLCN